MEKSGMRLAVTIFQGAREGAGRVPCNSSSVTCNPYLEVTPVDPFLRYDTINCIINVIMGGTTNG